MAGSRPTSFKKTGGFLNNVDGTIAGYEFTDVFPGSDGKPRKGAKQSDFNPLYCVLSARVDGAEDDVTTTLFVGSADEFTIEDDGHTLTPNEDGALRASSEFATFIVSLVEAGFPETSLPEDRINYEAMIGTRVRFVQRPNEEKTKRLGKRKGKDGKAEYARTDLVVEQVYSLATNGRATKKPMVKAAAPVKGKAVTKPGNGHAADVDLDELAVETLLGILADRAPINKAKLSVPVLKALKTHPQRQDVYKLLFDDDFLAREEGWRYDATKQEVNL